MGADEERLGRDEAEAGDDSSWYAEGDAGPAEISGLYWYEDPEIARVWVARAMRRRVVHVIGVLVLCGWGALAGWLTSVPDARDAMACWITLGHTPHPRETPGRLGD